VNRGRGEGPHAGFNVASLFGRSIRDNDGVETRLEPFRQGNNGDPAIGSARSGKCVIGDRRDPELTALGRLDEGVDILAQPRQQHAAGAVLGQPAHARGNVRQPENLLDCFRLEPLRRETPPLRPVAQHCGDIPAAERYTLPGALRDPVITLRPVLAVPFRQSFRQVARRQPEVVARVMINQAGARPRRRRLQVVDAQVGKRTDPPAVIDQAKGQVVLLCRHEQRAVQASNPLERRAAQAHAASDEHVVKRAAFAPAVGQVGQESGGAEATIGLEMPNHPREAAGPWKRVVVEKHDVFAAGAIDPEGLRASPVVSTQRDAAHLRKALRDRLRRAVAGCVVNHDDLGRTGLHAEAVQPLQRRERQVATPIRGDDDADTREVRHGRGPRGARAGRAGACAIRAYRQRAASALILGVHPGLTALARGAGLHCGPVRLGIRSAGWLGVRRCDARLRGLRPGRERHSAPAGFASD